MGFTINYLLQCSESRKFVLTKLKVESCKFATTTVESIIIYSSYTTSVFSLSRSKSAQVVGIPNNQTSVAVLSLLCLLNQILKSYVYKCFNPLCFSNRKFSLLYNLWLSPTTDQRCMLKAILFFI